MNGYGTSNWFERIYQSTDDDPWGLSWRPTQLYRYGRMLSELGRVLDARRATSTCIVDIGCATGDFTAMLASLPGSTPRQVVGMDLSETAVNRARARFPEIEFAVGGASEAAARFRCSADLVCCLEVIYYIPVDQRAAMIRDLASMLKPGGLLLISSMIAPPPYLDAEALCNLVNERLPVHASGVLNLRPLTDIEKVVLKLRRRRRGGAASQYLPGAPGYARLDRITALLRKTLGRRSESHAFAIAGA
jgi:SAM-dependent methyltransferase